MPYYNVHVDIYGVDESKPFTDVCRMEQGSIQELCEYFPMVGKFTTIHHYPKDKLEIRQMLEDNPADYVSDVDDLTIALRIRETAEKPLWVIDQQVDVEKLKKHMSATIDLLLMRRSKKK